MREALRRGGGMLGEARGRSGVDGCVVVVRADKGESNGVGVSCVGVSGRSGGLSSLGGSVVGRKSAATLASLSVVEAEDGERARATSCGTAGVLGTAGAGLVILGTITPTGV